MREKKSKEKPSLQEEVAFLKRSVASYKSANTVLRGKVANLEAYSKEADELNEKRISEIDHLTSTLRGKEASIAGLESQVNALKETIAEREAKIKELKRELAAVNDSYENYLSMPWYKRIFCK